MSSIDPEGAAELLKALGHVTRLAILNALVEQERSVGELEQASGIAQPALSQQLAVLRNAQLVTTRRESKQVFYSINHSRLAELRAALDSFAGKVATSREQPVALKRKAGATSAMFARIG